MTDFLGNIFTAFAIITILATLIPLSPKENWWIRALDFPRLQIIAAGLICLGGFLYFDHGAGTLQWVLESGLAGCIICHGWRIFPYTSFSKKMVLDSELPAEKQERIKVVVTNVLETNRNYTACLSMLR